TRSPDDRGGAGARRGGRWNRLGRSGRVPASRARLILPRMTPGAETAEGRLAQLLFDELDVLPDLGVVPLHPQLLGRELLVLRRGVEVARSGGRDQLDLLAHAASSWFLAAGGVRGGWTVNWRGRRDSNPRPPA